MVIKEFERVMWHVVRVMVVRRSALQLYISTANQPTPLLPRPMSNL